MYFSALTPPGVFVAFVTIMLPATPDSPFTVHPGLMGMSWVGVNKGHAVVA
jgi:uncharacterized membrane protein YdjX (TVP38/TMEM64 family)